MLTFANCQQQLRERVIMSPVPALSSTNPVSYSTAKTKALQLISAFNASSIVRSSHYPKLSKNYIVTELKKTLNNTTKILSQEGASLCGPAAFFFTLAEVRPDIYVELVVDLYTNGKTQLKDLKLRSSDSARHYEPTRMRHSDWLLLSSIKPEYDNPNEQFDGITLPGKLKEWFIKAGFGTVVDYTNLITNKGLDTLLQVQNDYASGYKICLFVDANVFRTLEYKSGRSLIPNHWVVMTSDVKLRKYDEKTKLLAPPTIVNQSIVKTIQQQISAKKTQSILDGDFHASPETNDRILLKAFTWGNVYSPVTSKISSTQDARLSYFLNGFYGYIKVKR